MRKVALYCRVSSDDQRERDTIENQIEILNTYVEMKDNLEIYKEYLDNGISGTVPFEQRPYGGQLIHDASIKLFDTILVWKIDRFGRDTLSGLKAIEMISKYNIEIMSITEPFDLNTPTGRFQFITYLNMAELERNNILDRMYLGATRAAKKGKWMGGIIPYGYVVNNNGFLEINEDEAKIIRQIYNLYINEKLSTINVAVYLNNSSIPSSCGSGKGKRTKNISSKWRASSIQRILTSTTYKGVHFYGTRGTRRKELIERKVPAIITEELWNKVQIIKKQNMLISKRNMKAREYLVRGLIVCGQCGKTYYGISYKQKNSVYSCNGKRGENKIIMHIKCDNANVSAHMIEDEVWNDCLKILQNYDKYIQNLKQVSSNIGKNKMVNNLIKLESKLSDAANEKNNILTLFRKNIISEIDVKNQLEDIKKEQNKILNLINTFKEKDRYNKHENELINNMSDKLKYYNSIIDKLTFRDKYDIVHLLVKNIIINPIFEHGKKIPEAKITYNLLEDPPVLTA